MVFGVGFGEFGALFAGVDVDGEVVGVVVGGDFLEPGAGDGADAVGGDAEGDEGVVGVVFLEGLEACEVGVGVGFDEASLARIGGFLEAGAVVGDA